MSDIPEPTVWGEIDGRTITFPMEVPAFDAATLIFSVPAGPAQALLPPQFRVVEMVEDVAQLVIALVDYHDNPWGDYLEVNLGFLVRPVDADESVLGSFVWRMPVDQAFTCKAGNEVMGFPKTVEDLRREQRGERVVFGMDVDGQVEIEVSFAEPVQPTEPTRIVSGSYSLLDGVAYETPLATDMGSGTIDPSTVEIELGHGIVAEELRSLGLPKAPDMGTWGTGLSATFHLGHPIAAS